MIKKGNCFGRCPVFDLTIKANGEMDYKGKMFVDNLGLWKGSLPADQHTAILRKIEAANILQLENTYESGAMDYPRRTLTVFYPDSAKTISGDFSLPASIKEIITEIDSVGHLATWRQYEAHVPRSALPGEIMAKLNVDDPEVVLKAFAEQGLSLERRIAPNLPMYLFKFPTEGTNAGRLLVMIRQHPAVEMAQFNQEVNERQ